MWRGMTRALQRGIAKAGKLRQLGPRKAFENWKRICRTSRGYRAARTVSKAPATRARPLQLWCSSHREAAAAQAVMGTSGTPAGLGRGEAHSSGSSSLLGFRSPVSRPSPYRAVSPDCEGMGRHLTRNLISPKRSVTILSNSGVTPGRGPPGIHSREAVELPPWVASRSRRALRS